MIIYKYHKGVIYTFEARETKTMYIVYDIRFECNTRFLKKECSISRKKEIKRVKAGILSRISLNTEKANQAILEMEELKKL